MDEKIVNTALSNLERNTGIRSNFIQTKTAGLDGKADLFFTNDKETFVVEVKKEIRNHQVGIIIDWATQYPNLLVIAEHIFPKVKEELRKHNIAWLDTAGNIFLNTGKHHIWIEGHKEEKLPNEKLNRAFTITGLKVVYQFLIDETMLQRPYRDIAHKAGVALGNINYIINGLKEQKFLIKENRQRLKLVNKKGLIEKWITGYEEKLKPILHLANFRFKNNNDYYNWKLLPLKQYATFWGGEPAGEIITKYLKPEIFTIYTEEKAKDLIKEYHLIPDPEGKVKVFNKFWQEQKTFNPKAVHPLLAYADLMNTGEGRCIETAKIIYDKHIKPNL